MDRENNYFRLKCCLADLTDGSQAAIKQIIRAVAATNKKSGNHILTGK